MLTNMAYSDCEPNCQEVDISLIYEKKYAFFAN